MKIGENSEDLSAGSICLSVDEAKPFQTVSIKLTVRADLQLSKDGLLFEHRVSKVNGWFSFDLRTIDLRTFDLGHLISDVQSSFSFDLQQHIHI